MIFINRILKEEIISYLKQELKIKLIDMNSTLINEIFIGILTKEKKNKFQIKTYIKKVFTNDENKNIK